MNIELFPLRKPRSDSALKSFSQEIQDKIVQYAHGRSLREVQAWLQEKHHVKRALSTISEFLSWSRTIEQRYRNQGAIEALVAPLGPDGVESTDTPELTEEELRTHARRYFLETIIHDCNISAWHQSERIALGREELELKRQQLELKQKKLDLKREELELKRRKIEAKRGRGEEGKGGTRDNIQHPEGEEQTPNTNSDKSRAGLLNNYQQSTIDSQQSDNLQPSHLCGAPKRRSGAAAATFNLQRGFLDPNWQVGEEPENFQSDVLFERARSSWICNETMIK